MKITNLLLLASPISAMALPSNMTYAANITHAAQSEAPVQDHHIRNIAIGAGIGGSAIISLVGLQLYKMWKIPA